MSISSLTTLGAVRDSQLPTRRDARRTTESAEDAETTADWKDVLVTQVPTEVVAPYTAVMAIIVGAIEAPTATHPHPDQLALLRWVAFGILLLLTVVLVWVGKQRKSKAKRPVAEVVGATVAATGWALALPESPLAPYLHSTAYQVAVPALVAFAAVGLVAVVGVKLTQARA